jgi:hypothetical protein
VLNPQTNELSEKFAEQIAELRKDKGVTLERAQEIVHNCAYSARCWGHLDKSVRRLTEPNSGWCAIGAFDGGRLIDVANYVVADDDPHVAEVAVAVAHDDHRLGVKTALITQLGKIAVWCGVHHLAADVLGNELSDCCR